MGVRGEGKGGYDPQTVFFKWLSFRRTYGSGRPSGLGEWEAAALKLRIKSAFARGATAFGTGRALGGDVS